MRQGMKRPLGMLAPYVQQAMKKYTMNRISSVGRVNAPVCNGEKSCGSHVISPTYIVVVM